MNKSNHKRETCRLCGGSNLDLALRLAPTPLADSYVPASLLNETQQVYPLELDLCLDCGFSQLRDIIQPEIIYVDYIYETKSSLGLAEHFGRYADAVMERIQPSMGALVVDIGSNDGTLLMAFKKHGARVLGIDPAREIARKATESGVETIADFFTPALAQRLGKEFGQATIITANNIFANVDDLDEMAKGIKGLLAPDGVFVFESFYMADLMKNMVFDFLYHEHLSCFSVKPLAGFFQKHGMELIHAEHVPTKGGSLRYTAQLAGGPRKVSAVVGEMIASETNQGIHSLAAFHAFAERIDSARADLRNLLTRLESDGKKVDGFGASATTTTLLYHFGLTAAVGAIYDDYESKQNLFSPGAHIPVLPPEEIKSRKPDYILVFAWRYYEPILKKHAAFREAGGKFIVPLPALTVL